GPRRQLAPHYAVASRDVSRTARRPLIDTMHRNKPVIGIVGGIGSGKSYVARLFGERGCLVIDSDAQVRAAYRDPRVRATLLEWWGGGVFTPAGEIDKGAIAHRIFGNPDDRHRLESLLHPMVAEARRQEMEAAA